MNKPKAVLFDWDGTLYDSSILCFEIYRELFCRFGAGELTFEEFRRDFSGDYHKFQEKHGLDSTRWDEFDSAWYEIYYSKQKGESKAKLFPNAKKTLKRMHDSGIPVGIVTNATRNRMKGEISELKLGGYLAAVVTIEDADWQFKPSPKLVNLACEQMGIEKNTAIFIGDMAEDVKAGKGAGVITGVVTTGVHTLEKLLKE
jgi:HAD superfamily hydrolase (TIGR01662 family)